MTCLHAKKPDDTLLGTITDPSLSAIFPEQTYLQSLHQPNFPVDFEGYASGPVH